MLSFDEITKKADRIVTLNGRVSKKITFAVLVMVASWLFYLHDRPQLSALDTVTPQQFLAEVAHSTGSGQAAELSLITQPDDGVGSIKFAIENAARSVDLVIYELQDSQIEQALVDAHNRGVKVRVILQNVNTFGHKPNEGAYAFLQGNGVPIRWAGKQFFLTHQKTLIVDGAAAFIMTFNLMSKYYETSRDFGIITTNHKDIAAIQEVFDADWAGKGVVPSRANGLVWSPGSAPTLLSLIDYATASLDVYSLEMDEPRITRALGQAAERGVNVRIIMTYQSDWKPELGELTKKGALVRTYASSAGLFIHAKMMLADMTLAFIGSENFSAASLNDNRELGMMVSSPEIIYSLAATFNADWDDARPYAIKE